MSVREKGMWHADFIGRIKCYEQHGNREEERNGEREREREIE